MQSGTDERVQCDLDVRISPPVEDRSMMCVHAIQDVVIDKVQ